MFGHHPLLQAELRSGGQRAFAKIVSAKRTRIAQTVGSEAVVGDTQILWKLLIRVEPQGEPPFEAKVDALLPQLWSPEPGSRYAFAVLYDPNNHSKVVLDRSEEGYRALEQQLGQQHTAEMVDKMRSRGQNVVADRFQAAHDAGLFRTDDLPQDPDERRRQMDARRNQIKQIMAGQTAEDRMRLVGESSARYADKFPQLREVLGAQGVQTDEELQSHTQKLLGD
jgi:hypothetical protein